VTVHEGELLPSVRHAVRHAICGYRWAGDRVALCGAPRGAGQADAPKCPACVAAAQTHGQTCDCWKRWPSHTTIEGTLAPQEIR
jgi:hypothetical protein